MVFAEDEGQALEQAKMAGHAEETTFIDRHGRSIRWRMLAVKDLQPIELVNGGLLFSQVREVDIVPAPIWAA